MVGILLIDVLAVIGLILLLVRVGTQPGSGIRSSAVTKWRDDEVVITYREKPPHFRDRKITKLNKFIAKSTRRRGRREKEK